MKRRVAIVTGASSGIGLALAERAVRAGWCVYAVGRRAERLAQLARTVENATGTLATSALDLRSPHAARTIVAGTLERFGSLDVLVNNAGGVAVGPIAEQRDAALHEQMETHVIVPLALTREALPALRASRGHVFYVGSGVARIPVGTLGAYPPAKAAVRNMTRIVRNELRADGIAVTYVDPGAVATEFMTRAGFAGPPPGLAASPYDVARKIFKAFETRPSVVNGVPWQTLVVALGEAFPAVTDFVLRRAPQIVGGEPLPPALAGSPPASEAQPSGGEIAPARAFERDLEVPAQAEHASRVDAFEAAVEPNANRMRRLNLKLDFVRALLAVGTELEVGDVALRWAGMPNKNERALTREVLESLADAAFLERLDLERYRVVKAAERSSDSEG